MKNCPKCNTQLDDSVMFCTNCGTQFFAQAGQQQQSQQYAQGAAPPNYAPAYDPFDHTAEFDPKDISDNKVFAMLAYLLGVFGIIIALLASRSSDYTMFHIRQALKFTVINILMAICALVLFWTFIVPILYSIAAAVLGVVKIICFVGICQGKAKEPVIIRSIKFLK